MMYRIKKTKTVTTAGELIEALKQFDPDAPIECEQLSNVLVEAMHDYDTDEFAYLELSGIDLDQ